MVDQNTTMESRFCREPMKERLARDFAYVMNWAKSHHRPDIETAATTMFNVVSSPDPARALRHGGAQTRDALQAVSDIGQELTQKPQDDPDRNDQRLRIASRRASEFMKADGWHFQHT